MCSVFGLVHSGDTIFFILATSRFGETGVQCSMAIIDQLIDNY